VTKVAAAAARVRVALPEVRHGRRHEGHEAYHPGRWRTSSDRVIVHLAARHWTNPRLVAPPSLPRKARHGPAVASPLVQGGNL
jgi:hypothetical protein